jgi:hypothetical protein
MKIAQIAQQHVELCRKQVLPARPQMRKQRRLVGQQLIETAIQHILRDQRIIAKQIRHRALLEPLPMQAPFAAGVDQPIAHQRRQCRRCKQRQAKVAWTKDQFKDAPGFGARRRAGQVAMEVATTFRQRQMVLRTTVQR